jgi:hypothetical protein
MVSERPVKTTIRCTGRYETYNMQVDMPEQKYLLFEAANIVSALASTKLP